MALVRCPDCGRKVSDRAVACPECACPIAGTHNTEPPRPGATPHNTGPAWPDTQTIEQTGKGYKVQQVAAVLLMLVGMVGCMAGGEGRTGEFMGALMFAGVAWYVYARMGAWWHHG
jgi:hypothetical protein